MIETTATRTIADAWKEEKLQTHTLEFLAATSLLCGCMPLDESEVPGTYLHERNDLKLTIILNSDHTYDERVELEGKPIEMHRSTWKLLGANLDLQDFRMVLDCHGNLVEKPAYSDVGPEITKFFWIVTIDFCADPGYSLRKIN